MSIELTRFAVIGLHHKFDVDIPITDNKLILIGVNGLGKTTVVNLIYFLLTLQWERLIEYDFSAIEITLNDNFIRIDREDIQSKLKLSDRYEKVLARSANRFPGSNRIFERIVTHPLFPELSAASVVAREKIAIEISREIGIPFSYVMRISSDIPKSVQEDLFLTTRDAPSIVELIQALKTSGNTQVIYLPTYRRIEQDIKSIFPNLDEDELRKITTRSDRMLSQRNRGHVELIQFGMKDVESRIADELENIRERTRSQLTNLTATYLKDIIRNRADAIPSEYFHTLDDKVVAAVLMRVDENTLSPEDKNEIESAIKRVREGNSGHEARDKYLAYFFSRLLEIYLSLAESEDNIRRLAETCNRYLEGKTLHYDDSSFEAYIADEEGEPLSWTVLSSGEKQVASLFTHLFLSKNNEQAVIIDEPELSLSVIWQMNLLPDIANSQNCKLLIAVTHSPFIYTNELDAYVVDLSKCTTPTSQPKPTA